MGLLDDAIREHLELKRKHGADPEDVARQEAEALGPGRKNEFAQPDEPEAPAAVSAGEAEEAAEPEPPLQEEPEAAAPPAGPQEEDPWLDDDRDEVPADEALQTPPERTGEEDVLEETPDFLQETPEHDRLWFEQKPPKDFDWDK
jgi:hypothetical protein